jgi:uncharacterized protein (TIGR02452 family)
VRKSCLTTSRHGADSFELPREVLILVPVFAEDADRHGTCETPRFVKPSGSSRRGTIRPLPDGRSCWTRCSTDVGKARSNIRRTDRCRYPGAAGRETRIAVENASVLDVGRRMAGDGSVAALNFASAAVPGGGFQWGALAQEESIARSSGLFPALDGRAMYAYHCARRDPMYSDYVIYSPNVPFFRTDRGDLLEEPWTMTILTSPAVYGDHLRVSAPDRLPAVPAVMGGRTAKVTAVAAEHHVTRFILGAWGCVAFGLDPQMMAGSFARHSSARSVACSREVVFAVLDPSPDRGFIGPFQRAFGS